MREFSINTNRGENRMENVIELIDVYKAFKSRSILVNVNLSIKKGQTIGIVGPNGSGKSVLFKLIAGFLRADKGEVYIRGKLSGKDFDFPSNMGVLINKPGFINIFNGFKNLQFLAGINNKIDDQKIRNTLKMVGLDPDDKTRVGVYSMGMQKKLGIAQAIMEDQDIIILDEPFNALDFRTYKDIKNIIREQQRNGNTILLTSHNHADIEELCDYTYIILDSKLEQLTQNLLKDFLQEH